MADLGEQVEADRAADLGQGLQDGASEHAIIRILCRALDLGQEPDMVALIGLYGEAGLPQDGELDLSLVELHEDVNDDSVAVL